MFERWIVCSIICLAWHDDRAKRISSIIGVAIGTVLIELIK